MDGVFQCAIDVEAFFVPFAAEASEFVSDDGTKTITGCPIGSDAYQDDFPFYIVVLFQNFLQRGSKVKKCLGFARIEILYHNFYQPFY